MGQVSKTQGIKFEVGDGASPEVFTAIGGITSWSDSGISRGEGDCTDLDSVQKETYATLGDPGTFSIELNIADGSAEHQQLVDDAGDAAGVPRNYRVTRADGSTVRKEFNAFVKSFSQTGSSDGHITASCEFRLTGAATDTI